MVVFQYYEVNELKAEIGRGEFLRCATPEPVTLASGAPRGSGA